MIYFQFRSSGFLFPFFFYLSSSLLFISFPCCAEFEWAFLERFFFKASLHFFFSRKKNENLKLIESINETQRKKAKEIWQ